MREQSIRSGCQISTIPFFTGWPSRSMIRPDNVMRVPRADRPRNSVRSVQVGSASRVGKNGPIVCQTLGSGNGDSPVCPRSTNRCSNADASPASTLGGRARAIIELRGVPSGAAFNSVSKSLSGSPGKCICVTIRSIQLTLMMEKWMCGARHDAGPARYGPGFTVVMVKRPSASVTTRPPPAKFGSNGALKPSSSWMYLPDALACQTSTMAPATGLPS